MRVVADAVVADSRRQQGAGAQDPERLTRFGAVVLNADTEAQILQNFFCHNRCLSGKLA